MEVQRPAVGDDEFVEANPVSSVIFHEFHGRLARWFGDIVLPKMLDITGWGVLRMVLQVEEDLLL